jgi:hypothetical protein
MGGISLDPRVQDIARALVAEGRHEIRLERGNLQAVVDAGWAARQAGQLLGRTVRVRTGRGDEPGGGLVVTVVLVED